MPEPKRTVLLLDRDPQVVQQVRLSLHGPTCRVAVAESPELAWKHRPDLVLLEQTEGPDGLALVGGIVQQGCPVLVLAAEVSIAQHMRALHLGAWGYLQKPVDGTHLARRVRRAFARLSRGERPAPVTGHSTEELVALLERVDRDACTGVLTLQRPGAAGHVLFAFGEVQIAEMGRLRGQTALNALGSYGDWAVSFKEGQKDTDASPTVRRPRQAAGLSPDATREVFYGPPTADFANGGDPHQAVTLPNEAAHLEARETLVDAPRGLEAPPTGEFIDEDCTTNQDPPPFMTIVDADDLPEEETDPRASTPQKRRR